MSLAQELPTVEIEAPHIGAVGVSLQWECPTPEFTTLACQKCYRAHVRQVVCVDRTCRPCGSHRAGLYIGKHRVALEEIGRVGGTFLTLTIPNVYQVDRRAVRKLRAIWTKTRRSREGKKLRFGFYSIETTPGKSLGWNLHMHVVAVGRVSYKRIGEAWRRAGGGWIHASTIRGVRHAIRYIAKEFTKGVLVEHGEALKDAYAGLKGVRLIQTFGKHPKEPPYESPVCSCGGALSYIESVCMPPDAMFWWEEEVGV